MNSIARNTHAFGYCVVHMKGSLRGDLWACGEFDAPNPWVISMTHYVLVPSTTAQLDALPPAEATIFRTIGEAKEWSRARHSFLVSRGRGQGIGPSIKPVPHWMA